MGAWWWSTELSSSRGSKLVCEISGKVTSGKRGQETIAVKGKKVENSHKWEEEQQRGEKYPMLAWQHEGLAEIPAYTAKEKPTSDNVSFSLGPGVGGVLDFIRM